MPLPVVRTLSLTSEPLLRLDARITERETRIDAEEETHGSRVVVYGL